MSTALVQIGSFVTGTMLFIAGFTLHYDGHRVFGASCCATGILVIFSFLAWWLREELQDPSTDPSIDSM